MEGCHLEISRLKELEPNWDLPKAEDQGFMRNLWAHVNEETGGDNFMVGVVHQPPGNGMPGLHKYETIGCGVLLRIGHYEPVAKPVRSS